MSRLFTFSDRPLVVDLLTELRDQDTREPRFRELLALIGHCLAQQVAERLPYQGHTVNTPLGPYTGQRQAGRAALIPVLRAGETIIDPFLLYLRNPYVWHMLMSRDEETLESLVLDSKIPPSAPEDLTVPIILEVMCATGGSACKAISYVRECVGPDKSPIFVAVLGAKAGIDAVTQQFPDVPVYCAAIDDELTEHGFIYPGLGDAGDRAYPTV